MQNTIGDLAVSVRRGRETHAEQMASNALARVLFPAFGNLWRTLWRESLASSAQA
jgi:hypothetical protein